MLHTSAITLQSEKGNIKTMCQGWEASGKTFSEKVEGGSGITGKGFDNRKDLIKKLELAVGNLWER